jgi:hypothetical protein
MIALPDQQKKPNPVHHEGGSETCNFFYFNDFMSGLVTKAAHARDLHDSALLPICIYVDALFVVNHRWQADVWR